MTLEINKRKDTGDGNWVTFQGEKGRNERRGNDSDRGTSGKLGSKQKTQRGFMDPLNIAMDVHTYTFEKRTLVRGNGDGK